LVSYQKAILLEGTCQHRPELFSVLFNEKVTFVRTYISFILIGVHSSGIFCGSFFSEIDILYML